MRGLLLCTLVGCAAHEPDPLMGGADAWRLAAPRDDPFDDEPHQECTEAGFGVENGVFELNTELCSRATFVQPLTSGREAGSLVYIDVMHDQLWAPDPGEEAHIAVGIGDIRLLSARVPIPSPAARWSEVVALERAVSPGELAWFHVHNHGSNAYRLLRFSAPWPARDDTR